MPVKCYGQFLTSSNGSLVSSIKEISAGREMSTLAQTNGTRSANLDLCSRPNREEPGSRLPLHGTEPWCVKPHQSESFLFFCWPLAGRCARANVLHLICPKHYSLAAQTHQKRSARRCLRGNHFLTLPRCNVQPEQKNFTRSSRKRDRP